MYGLTFSDCCVSKDIRDLYHHGNPYMFSYMGEKYVLCYFYEWVNGNTIK